MDLGISGQMAHLGGEYGQSGLYRGFSSIPSGGDTRSFVAKKMARFGMLEAAQRDEMFIPSKPLELGEISWSQNPLQ